MFFQVKELCSGYGAIGIVMDVSLSVDKGDICVILGRNGVGKTTLMKTLIGSLKVRAGEIRFEGRGMERMPTHARARLGIAYVPQGRGIFSDLTVEENLRMGEGIGSGKPPYDEVFAYFPRLRERLRQKGGTLSGGEQSQLALGRALIGNPRLALLDEPSEGVQPNIVDEMGEVLARLNRETGLTIILVEQNIEYALGIATTCRIMAKGRLVEEVGKDELSDPETRRRHLAI
ncbi:MAG: ABC transporter ATP-binding protein [Planctomycetota bacterium]|jgi:branched-chain amino acid transport system ATP-binding protein|nr:ABC transporter ATP-binding protein [Planctomycetota bacterium]